MVMPCQVGPAELLVRVYSTRDNDFIRILITLSIMPLPDVETTPDETRVCQAESSAAKPTNVFALQCLYQLWPSHFKPNAILLAINSVMNLWKSWGQAKLPISPRVVDRYWFAQCNPSHLRIPSQEISPVFWRRLSSKRKLISRDSQNKLWFYVITKGKNSMLKNDQNVRDTQTCSKYDLMGNVHSTYNIFAALFVQPPSSLHLQNQFF